MNPLSCEQIRGTWAALLLPINADDSIDYARLEAQLDHLLASGLEGVYSHGTAGEFHAQTEEEFDRVALLLAEKAEKRGVPFQIGASHMSAQVALERTRRARELRPGAIQITLPDWLPVSEDEAAAFLLRIAETADPVGLVLYNPPNAKRVFDLAALGRLRAAVPAIVGVKMVDGGVSWYAEMRRHLSGCSVFVPGRHVVTGLLNGARGSYSNIACLSPGGAARWAQLAANDPARALATERRVIEFFLDHVVPAGGGAQGGALDKLLAVAGGWCDLGVRMRWPYRSCPESAVPAVRAAARKLLPEFLADGRAGE